MNHTTRTIAATLIAGSALFGLSPVASADETPGPKHRTHTSQESRKMPDPPASAPRWVKRVVKQVNKFFDQNRGPVRGHQPAPGKPPNVACSVFGKHCN